jgi:hypothetical protein
MRVLSALLVLLLLVLLKNNSYCNIRLAQPDAASAGYHLGKISLLPMHNASGKRAGSVCDVTA